MLSDLHIENIAVIERADISFSKGLNVLTGETGAGKSIIIDALLAVMGARTSRELVRTGAEKALATAVFTGGKANGWLTDNGVETEDELILQRRIVEDGKSSCRVCGSPVSASQLRELSSLLLDIHGQNDGRQLLDEERHREYLDSYGGYGAVFENYKNAYDRYHEIRKEIKRLSMDEAEKERLSDRLRGIVEELEKAKLREGEEEELTERRELLHNAEKLTEAINSAYGTLYGGDESAVSLTDGAKTDVARAARYSADLSKCEKTLTDASFMLRDVAETLRDFLSGLDFSPEEYDRIETRLALLRKLSKKYGGGEIELLEKLEKSKKQLDDIEYSDDRLVKLTSQLEKQKAIVTSEAKKLTDARRRAAQELEKRIVDELKALSMPAVSFLVDITPIDNLDGFDGTGGDAIRFLMTANKGEKPGPISRIASGGELSRIMLAMKNVFSEKDELETLVFDEIDTGVSGVAASRVGEKLSELSRHKQVLCVTHLPQIAAMADTHFLIEKEERDGRTYTSVTELDREGRARELARLHGGDNITENTLISAGEQLDAAERFKSNK
ncbi:MAG: DNA repair protein RecN [Firmicutes bacterium HGW-Firmicutes-16]|nr:MAG: DNA repair protein RecN [Firmicutes bacterium HGW-Firmicutes-16]